MYEKLVSDLKKEHAEASAEDDINPQDVWDIQLNLLACYIAVGKSSVALTSAALEDVVSIVLNYEVLSEDLPYELVYNIACALIDDNKPILAAKALQQALQVGARFLQEGDSSASDILHELAGVRTQAALLLQSSHYDEAALAIYAQISGSGKGKHHGSGAIDASTVAVANNNHVIINVDTTNTTGTSSSNKAVNSNRLLIETLKRINVALTNADSTKLTRRQVLTLSLNRCIILLQLRKIDECTAYLQDIRTLINQERTQFGNHAGYLGILSQHADAVDIALRYQKSILTNGLTNAVTSTTASIKETAENSIKSSTGIDVNPIVGAYVQNLVNDGKFTEAATILENILKTTYANNPLPAIAATVCQLYFCSGTMNDTALKAIDTCVNFWSSHVKKNGTKITDKLNMNHGFHMLLQSLLVRAGALTQIRKYAAAASDYDTVLKLPNISQEYKAAAYASLSTLRMQQAGNTSVDDTTNRSRLVTEADTYLKEAKTIAGSSTSTTSKASNISSPSRSRRGSRVGMMDSNDETLLDQLEWTPPDQRSSNKSSSLSGSNVTVPGSPKRDGSTPPSPRMGGAISTTSTATIPPLASDDTAKLAAKNEARKARIRRKRAIRREKYIAALKASGKYLVNIPAPNPDRWIPRRERFRKKNKGGKGYTTGSGHQGGVDKRIETQLDVRARTEAEKMVAASSSSSSSTTTTSTTGGKKGSTTTTSTTSTTQPNAAVLAAQAAGAKKKGKGKK